MIADFLYQVRLNTNRMAVVITTRAFQTTLTLYLQVEDDNLPAQALARQLGTQRAYGYWYRELDPQAA